MGERFELRGKFDKTSVSGVQKEVSVVHLRPRITRVSGFTWPDKSSAEKQTTSGQDPLRSLGGSHWRVRDTTPRGEEDWMGRDRVDVDMKAGISPVKANLCGRV